MTPTYPTLTLPLCACRLHCGSRAGPCIHRGSRRHACSSYAAWLLRGPRIDHISRDHPRCVRAAIGKRLPVASGADFAVGYSPERIDPSNLNWTLHNTPKIVSGIDAASVEAVDAFYSVLVDTTVRAANIREAEVAKLLENTFRHVQHRARERTSNVWPPNRNQRLKRHRHRGNEAIRLHEVYAWPGCGRPLPTN